jgi:ornithine--oxo-acid transaminase
MEVIKPGEHGSTFGGNPVASAVGMASLRVIQDEKLAQNARSLGKIFRKHLSDYKKESNVLVGVRGRGLLNAIIINDSEEGSLAWDICMAFKEKGLLAKPTHGNIIRFAPPLVITEMEILSCVQIIIDTLSEFEPS